MSKTKYITIKVFMSYDIAKEVNDYLTQNGVETQFDEAKNHHHESLVQRQLGGVLMDNFVVKVNASDFEKADTLLIQQAQRDAETAPQDYYLFDYDNEKLYQILEKPLQHDELDYVLAEKILRQRGENPNIDAIVSVRKEALASEIKKATHSGFSIFIIIGFTAIGLILILIFGLLIKSVL